MMLGIELASKVKWEVGMVLRYQLCICVTYDAASGVLIASAGRRGGILDQHSVTSPK
jgi:hypothetical protein